MLKRYLNIFICLAICLFSSACEQQTGFSEENVKVEKLPAGVNLHDFGKYTVHVSALTTDTLSADVAKLYQIQRSKKRAMLNVYVDSEANGNKASRANVTAVVRNLSNQLRTIEFREIEEHNPNTIYYIGEISVSNEEVLVFKVFVTPENHNETLGVQFQQQFFTQ